MDADYPHLIIRETTFRTSRLVVWHPTAAEMLRDYASRRRIFSCDALTDAFFVSSKYTALNHAQIKKTLSQLLREAGISATEGQRLPPPHSFRHTFAVERLCRWYKEGLSVHKMVPHLSTYLGHLRPEETYWSLFGNPRERGGWSL